MAWLYKQAGSTNWWIGYRLNGKQYLRSTKTEDKKEAQAQLERLKLLDQAHRAGSLTDEFFRIATASKGTNETFSAWVKQWIGECKDLSPRTLEKYNETIKEFGEHLHADEAAPLLRDVRPEAISAYIRQKRSATSTATARICRKVLRSFFSYAVDNQALQINPVPSGKSLKLTKESDRIRRAFTLEELRTLHTKAPTPFWKYMVMAGFYLGQRMGDLICLPWGAVDLESNVIRLTARKTGRAMHIPLRPELREFLADLKHKAGQVKPADPIWRDECQRYEKRGAGPFSNEFYDDVLLPAGLVPKRTHQAAKSGRSGQRQTSAISFHCLRHTFVSMLKLSGGSQAVAKELAGHSSDAVSDLYTHVDEASMAKAIKKLPEVTK